MNSATNLQPERKKKIIIALLVVSCIAAGIILASTTSESGPRLRSLAETDTIIVDELTKFNIEQEQIERHPVQVDSNFTRWIYRVNVSPHLSKTHLHTSLHERLHEMEVSSPARIYFPGKEMDIHLSYNNTVIRTIKLQNDTSLTHKSRSAHIIVYSESVPSLSTFELVEKFGEPIPLVVQISGEDLDEVERLAESRMGAYQHIAYWPGAHDPDSETGTEEMGMNELSRIRQLLGQISNRHSEGKMLYLRQSSPFELSAVQSTLKSHGIDVYSLEDPIVLEANAGRASYNQIIDEFKREAFNGSSPALLVKSNPELIQKLHETLIELKKQGLYISAPEQRNY